MQYKFILLILLNILPFGGKAWLGTCLCSYAQTPADSIAIVTASWDSRSIDKGVVAKHAKFSNLYGGMQDIYILEINTKRYHLETHDHDGRALTSDEASKANAVAAVNGNYFDMSENGRSICFTAHRGKVINYTQSSLGQLTNGAVIIRGKKVVITPWDVQLEHALFPDSVATKAMKKSDIMVCGPLMIQGGRELPFYDESHVMGKNPRSGIAVSGNTVYLVVVDGRDESRAVGVTIPEFAHFLRILGVDTALNLDGGGSSTLWARPEVRFYNDGTPVCPCTGILNVPSDKDHERRVSNSIIVR